MKRTLIIACLIVLLLAAGVAVYFNLGPKLTGAVNDISSEVSPQPTGEQSDTTTQENTSGNEEAPTQTDTEAQPEGPVKMEEVTVKNNSPEYDMKVTLIEDGSGQTSIKLEYYYEGAGTENTFDSGEIPEIEGIFEKRAESAAGFRIKAAWLNIKLSKLFMMINTEAGAEMANTSLYSISLSDAKVKKLKSEFGKFGDISFSKDYKYLAYSFADDPASSRLQESTLVDVIDCAGDEFVVRNSRDKSEKKIGSNLEPEDVYDYTFVSWNPNGQVRLKQKPVDGKSAEQEVLYDIGRNLILNLDGSVKSAIKPGQTPVPTEKPPAESAALKILKEFYTYLASEKDYSKAMALLDEKFVLKLEMIKQFGIEALYKSDISEENASAYSDLLKAAKLDAIVKEDSKDGETVIYYYQVMVLNSETQIRQPMSATMVKTGSEWKITVLQDADGSGQPFAAQ